MKPAPLKLSKKPASLSEQANIAATLVGADLRKRLIAETAYYRAQRRGFAPGHSVEDWLAAEAEVDTGLTIGVLGY
jgi:hypothetical protein